MRCELGCSRSPPLSGSDQPSSQEATERSWADVQAYSSCFQNQQGPPPAPWPLAPGEELMFWGA